MESASTYCESMIPSTIPISAIKADNIALPSSSTSPATLITDTNAMTNVKFYPQCELTGRNSTSIYKRDSDKLTDEVLCVVRRSIEQQSTLNTYTHNHNTNEDENYSTQSINKGNSISSNECHLEHSNIFYCNADNESERYYGACSNNSINANSTNKSNSSNEDHNQSNVLWKEHNTYSMYDKADDLPLPVRLSRHIPQRDEMNMAISSFNLMQSAITPLETFSAHSQEHYHNNGKKIDRSSSNMLFHNANSMQYFHNPQALYKPTSVSLPTSPMTSPSKIATTITHGNHNNSKTSLSPSKKKQNAIIKSAFMANSVSPTSPLFFSQSAISKSKKNYPHDKSVLSLSHLANSQKQPGHSKRAKSASLTAGFAGVCLSQTLNSSKQRRTHETSHLSPTPPSSECASVIDSSFISDDSSHLTSLYNELLVEQLNSNNNNNNNNHHYSHHSHRRCNGNENHLFKGSSSIENINEENVANGVQEDFSTPSAFTSAVAANTPERQWNKRRVEECYGADNHPIIANGSTGVVVTPMTHHFHSQPSRALEDDDNNNHDLNETNTSIIEREHASRNNNMYYSQDDSVAAVAPFRSHRSTPVCIEDKCNIKWQTGRNVLYTQTNNSVENDNDNNDNNDNNSISEEDDTVNILSQQRRRRRHERCVGANRVGGNVLAFSPNWNGLDDRYCNVNETTTMSTSLPAWHSLPTSPLTHITKMPITEHNTNNYDNYDINNNVYDGSITKQNVASFTEETEGTQKEECALETSSFPFPSSCCIDESINKEPFTLLSSSLSTLAPLQSSTSHSSLSHEKKNNNITTIVNTAINNYSIDVNNNNNNNDYNNNSSSNNSNTINHRLCSNKYNFIPRIHKTLCSTRKSHTRPFYPNPECVLDAPQFPSHASQLLHWGSNNKVVLGLKNTLYTWDAETRESVKLTELGEENTIHFAQWIHKASCVAMGISNDNKTSIFDCEQEAILRSVHLPEQRALGYVAVNGPLLAISAHATTQLGYIGVFDLRIKNALIASHDICSREEKWEEPEIELQPSSLSTTASYVTSLRYCHAEPFYLASGWSDGTVRIWDARRCSSPRYVYPHMHSGSVGALHWNPIKRTRLFTGGGVDGLLCQINTHAPYTDGRLSHDSNNADHEPYTQSNNISNNRNVFVLNSPLPPPPPTPWATSSSLLTLPSPVSIPSFASTQVITTTCSSANESGNSWNNSVAITQGAPEHKDILVNSSDDVNNGSNALSSIVNSNTTNTEQIPKSFIFQHTYNNTTTYNNLNVRQCHSCLVGAINTMHPITGMICSEDGEEILTSHRGKGLMQLRRTSDFHLMCVYHAHKCDADITCISLAPDKERVCAAQADESLKFWRVFEHDNKSSTKSSTKESKPNMNRLHLQHKDRLREQYLRLYTGKAKK